MLDECRVPVENLLGGEEKLARKLERARSGQHSRSADALATFEITRPIVGASALGIAQAAYEWTLEYLDGQSEAGVPLLKTQRIQQTLADVATEIEAARLLVQRAAWMGRNGVPMTGGQGSMSKLKAGDVTMWATTTLMDLVGPYAWNTDCPLEKWFRDAKIYQLFEGTAEIQRMVISRMQAREYAERFEYGAEVAAEAMATEARQGARSRLIRADGPICRPWDDKSARRRSYPRGVSDSHDHAGHSHGFGAHALEARREDSRRRMWVALAINVVCCSAEAIGGVLTGSLAVLADAGHLLSDVGSIVLALIAARLASLPAAGNRTFGYQRSEVLAALVNGLLLVAVSIGIAIAAIGRLSDPPGIDGAGVLALGVLGLAGNLAATLVLARGQREDINLEGVLRHSFADALGSLGVVLAGAFVLAGGSDIVDPIVGLLISGLVLASSWRLIKEPFEVLMESAPAGLDVDGMGAAICREEGVRSVHDLHVWTVTAGFGAVAAHVVVAKGADRDLIRRRLELTLRRGLRDRAHDPADGGGGRAGPAAGRERPREA